ncbi:hypothetical protein LUX32_00615 [Actinomadura madurae]|nr:hypothetical protein [Actinomadura madurae]MCP9976347.1 hypothetical protein [Actinomadura madurae]
MRTSTRAGTSPPCWSAEKKAGSRRSSFSIRTARSIASRSPPPRPSWTAACRQRTVRRSRTSPTNSAPPGASSRIALPMTSWR